MIVIKQILLVFNSGKLINPMNFQKIHQKRVIKPNLNEFWKEYMSLVTIHHKCHSLRQSKQMEPQNSSLSNRHNTHSHTHTIHTKTGEVEGERMYERHIVFVWKRRSTTNSLLSFSILKKRTIITSFYLTNKNFIDSIWLIQ